MSSYSNLVLSIVIAAGFITATMSYVYAFDAAKTVDQSNSKTLLTGPSTMYRFGQLQYRNVTYSDGSLVPSVTMSIELFNQTTQKWDIIGYTNSHLHKLKIDVNDKVDISIGHTDRINIKTTGAPNVPPPVID